MIHVRFTPLREAGRQQNLGLEPSALTALYRSVGACSSRAHSADLVLFAPVSPQWTASGGGEEGQLALRSQSSLVLYLGKSL